MKYNSTCLQIHENVLNQIWLQQVIRYVRRRKLGGKKVSESTQKIWATSYLIRRMYLSLSTITEAHSPDQQIILWQLQWKAAIKHVKKRRKLGEKMCQKSTQKNMGNLPDTEEDSPDPLHHYHSI